MKYELINSNTKADNIVSLVFENRNISESKIFDYIHCDKDFRTNPFDYVNMDRGIELVKKHIDNNSNILILVDTDCDGYMSASIVYKTLKELNKDLNISFLTNKDKKHGLNEKVIPSIIESNANLLIIPDAGSNDIEEIRFIQSNNIDVLVIDHHEACYHEDLIIINNQYNDINKDLSGGAMALKFSEALIGEKSEKYTDLAAVSIISDNMAMNNLENRYYVHKGLNNINNDFLRRAIKEYENAKITDISFGISPIVNSIIRVGNKEDKEILIKAVTELEGSVELPTRKNGKTMANYDYIDAAIKISKWRRAEQKVLVNEATEKVEVEHENPINIVMLGEEFNSNLTGYFANVVSSKNLKPTLVMKFDEESNSYKGSARSGKVNGFKDLLVNSELFASCEGHQGAFGVDITKENLHKFKEVMKTMKLPTETIYKVDNIYDCDDLKREDIEAIHALENIWGKNMDKPLFAVKLKDTALSLIGANGNTLKMTKNGKSYIKFNCSEEEIRNISNIRGLVDIDVVGTLEINKYGNYITPQINIVDFEIKNKEISYNLFDDEDDFEYLF